MLVMNVRVPRLGTPDPAPPDIEVHPRGIVVRAEEIEVSAIDGLLEDLRQRGMTNLSFRLAHVLTAISPPDARPVLYAATPGSEVAEAWVAEVVAQFPPDLDALDRWIWGPDTGRASMALVHALTGRYWRRERFDETYSVPVDAESFGLCLGLLEAVPELRARLGEVPGIAPNWRPYILVWGDLERLHRERRTEQLNRMLDVIASLDPERETEVELQLEDGNVTFPKRLLERLWPGADIDATLTRAAAEGEVPFRIR